MSNHPEYVLNRNKTHISLTGKVIRFEKGIPRPVPPDLVREVVGFGAERVEGEQGEGFEDEERVKPQEPQGTERDELILAAIEELVTDNNSDDFGASNAPKAAAIARVSGLKVDAKERDRAWMLYQARKSAEE